MGSKHFLQLSLLSLPVVRADKHYRYIHLTAHLSLVVWIAALLATRIVSASSMIAAMSIPVATLIVLQWFGTHAEADVSTGTVLARGSAPLTITIAIALLILWRHRANIGRLLRGEEPRIKSRTSTTSEG